MATPAALAAMAVNHSAEEMKEIYRVGSLVTAANTLIIGFAGALWILLVT